MIERPILFNDAMVRALLAGTKTQTRRVLQSPAKNMQREGMSVIKNRAPGDPWYGDHVWSMRGSMGVWGDYTDERFRSLCPYGVRGDRLWVRECFALSQRDQEDSEVSMRDPQWWDPPVYRADYAGGKWYRFEDNRRIPWRPSIHMPRWASRLSLEITSVRVERVQEITEEDVRAEGVPQVPDDLGHLMARAAFESLWDEINGQRHGCSWAANPWVWVVGFRRVEEIR